MNVHRPGCKCPICVAPREERAVSMTNEDAIRELSAWLKLMHHAPDDSTAIEDAVVVGIEAIRACQRAAFTPAEPPPQETDDARICPQDGSICWTPGCEVAYCQEEADRQAAESAAPAEPQTLEPNTRCYCGDPHCTQPMATKPTAPVSSDARPDRQITPQALDALLQELDDAAIEEDDDGFVSLRPNLIKDAAAALRSLQADASAKEEQAFKAGWDARNEYFDELTRNQGAYERAFQRSLAAYRTQTGEKP